VRQLADLRQSYVKKRVLFVVFDSIGCEDIQTSVEAGVGRLSQGLWRLGLNALIDSLGKRSVVWPGWQLDFRMISDKR
jgi:hypothetical protein